jgi:hypothetical protein
MGNNGPGTLDATAQAVRSFIKSYYFTLKEINFGVEDGQVIRVY